MIDNSLAQLRQELLNKYYQSDDGALRKCSDDKVVAITVIINNGKRELLSLHRAVFLMHHGWLPPCIDHINRNRLDNRIGNLRPATLSQNSKNKGLRSSSVLGYTGVSLIRGQYHASISINGKQCLLGKFATGREAFDVYYDKLCEIGGEFVPEKQALCWHKL